MDSSSSEPLYLTLGPSADATFAPELRTKRGLRGLGELRWALAPEEGGILSGFYGHDEIDERWRGAIGADHGWAPGPLRTGLRGQWVSDTDVLADYADSYLARSSPWTEVLGTIGVGPVCVETDTFQAWDTLQREIGPQEFEDYTAPRAVLERPVGAAFSLPGIRVGPIAGLFSRARTRSRTGSGSTSCWSPPMPDSRGARACRVAARSDRCASRAPSPDWRFRTTRETPGDRDRDGRRRRVDLERPRRAPPPPRSRRRRSPRRDRGRAGPPRRAGRATTGHVPRARAGQHVALTGRVPLHIRAALPGVDGEMEPTGSIRLGLGAWSSTVTADRRLQEGDVGRGDAVGRFDVGLGAHRHAPPGARRVRAEASRP